MNRKILVLGASKHQLPVIRAAKERGLEVHVIDNVPCNPGHLEADFSHIIDTTDVDAVVSLALEVRFDAVISPCTDIAVQTASSVSDALAVSGVPCSAAEVLTSKLRFREFLHKGGFNCPQFIEIATEAGGLNIGLDTPGIVKPDRSSGSKGVIMTDPANPNFLDHIDAAKCFSLNRRAIYEEVIDGHQGTLEGVLISGSTALAFFMDRSTAAPPHVCTYGHNMPTRLSSDVQQLVLGEVESVWSALKVRDTVFDVDFVWDGERVFILEMSPRLGGNSITDLVRYSTNVDLADIAIEMALGGGAVVDSFRAQKVCAVVLLGVSEEGVLTIDASKLDEVSRLDWVDDVNLYAFTGDKVLPFINGRACLASLFVSANELDELECRIKHVRTQRLFSIGQMQDASLG